MKAFKFDGGLPSCVIQTLYDRKQMRLRKRISPVLLSLLVGFLPASESMAGNNWTVSTQPFVVVTGSTDSDETREGERSTLAGVDSTLQEMTASEISAALQFAQDQSPALSSLMKKLSDRNPSEYKNAIRELHSDYQRLRRLKERQPKRYETELALWKLDTDIRLQVARYSVRQSDKLGDSIRRLLQKRQQIRQRRLEEEQKRLEARMELIQRQLAMSSSDLAAAVDDEFARLTRRTRQSAKRITNRPSSAEDAREQKRRTEDAKASRTKKDTGKNDRS